MRVLSLPEAEKSPDMDIKMVAGRASKYRVFGSPERIPDNELVVVDLRTGGEPADFAERFEILERHPFFPLMLARKLKN
jgi:hypothetical protein